MSSQPHGSRSLMARFELYDPASTDGKTFLVKGKEIKDQIEYLFRADAY